MPSEYTSVKHVYPAKFNTEFWALASPDYVSPREFPNYDIAIAEEFKWLDKCTDRLSELDHIYPPGWASHHASQKRGILIPSGITTIILLHREKVSTFNMQSHLMHLNMKWSETLNPGQTLVDVSDKLCTHLAKNCSCASQKYFLSIFLYSDSFTLSNVYWWFMDKQGISIIGNCHWEKIFYDRTLCNCLCE